MRGRTRAPRIVAVPAKTPLVSRSPHLARTLAAAALCLLARPAFAQVENLTKGELAMLPSFCQDVQGLTGWTKTNPSPRTPYWIGLMGDTFWAMHHYCWAMVHLQRAQAGDVTPQMRTFLIKGAISDFYYVVKNSPPDFVMLPELYYRTGKAYAMLGDWVNATEEFAKSRRLKPDYWPSYTGEADVLMGVGKPREAQEMIEEGLKHSPDQPALLRALERAKTALAQGPGTRKR